MNKPLLQRFRDTRARSLAVCEPLAIEDYGLDYDLQLSSGAGMTAACWPTCGCC